MQLHRGGIARKVALALRYLALRLFAPRVSTAGLVGIGTRCKITTPECGSIRLGAGVRLFDDVELQARRARLDIGAHTTINSYSRVVAFERITIGENCAIARFVTVLDHDHSFEYSNAELVFGDYRCSPVSIGSNVWLGEKCTILRGVTIGDNVIVGAHTLVNKDVESDCIVCGSPMRVIRRFKQNA